MSAFLCAKHIFLVKAAMHNGTLEMKQTIFLQFVKVFAHNQILYSPLQRQMSQVEVARRAFKANVKVILPRRAWLTYSWLYMGLHQQEPISRSSSRGVQYVML